MTELVAMTTAKEAGLAAHTVSIAAKQCSRYSHEHGMATIHKDESSAAFNESLQALCRRLTPQIGLQPGCCGSGYHVPGGEGGSQDGDKGEDAHVAEGRNERGGQAHTAKQQCIVPAEQASVMIREVACSTAVVRELTQPNSSAWCLNSPYTVLYGLSVKIEAVNHVWWV